MALLTFAGPAKNLLGHGSGMVRNIRLSRQLAQAQRSRQVPQSVQQFRQRAQQAQRTNTPSRQARQNQSRNTNTSSQATRGISAARMSELTDDFANNVTSSNVTAWKRGLQNDGLSPETIRDIIYQGSLQRGENIWGNDWARYYTEISGTPIPRGQMVRPHAHHLAEKVGGGSAGALNREILEEIGINPLLSKHNITWAPNVAGQHGFGPQSELLRRLLPVRGDRAGVVRVLGEWAEISRAR